MMTTACIPNARQGKFYWCQMTADRKEAIVDEIAGPGVWSQRKLHGKIMAGRSFSWLWEDVTVAGIYEPDVGDMIADGYHMYLHH